MAKAEVKTVKIYMLKKKKNFAYDPEKEYEVPADQAELLINEGYAKLSTKVAEKAAE